MMYNSVKYWFVGFVALVFAQSCGQPKTSSVSDTITSGTVKFAVDESCSPIIDEELYVFEQLNPQAKPIAVYRPENGVLGMLLNDSVRFAIMSRPLTPAETAVLKRRTLPPVTNKFAVDAIALIVNQASNDTTMTVGEIKKMLSGQTKTNKNIVFDNPNSGIVRYLTNFVGSGVLKQKNIYSLKSDKEVINYVSKNANAIGITGFTWLNDPDKDYADDVKKVKIVSVRDENSKDFPAQYFTPSQTTLALKQYPLTRNIYIINSTGKQGLGSGFAHFMMSDRGQRIVLRSGILPDSIPQREISIKHQLN
jgi:phosphate transport system substrate-binding protein